MLRVYSNVIQWNMAFHFGVHDREIIDWKKWKALSLGVRHLKNVDEG